jgi:2-polyprenyl-6-methoxyphenol hydroxylase-like FAD-dependent oxidoreductase
MLANELGRRGIRATLIDQKPTTAFNPQANATQARTMEHFRRLGFADEIRALGLPPDFPTDIAYFTRYSRHELARFRLPSSREASERVKQLSGSWSAAELPHRVSQKFVEEVLRRHAEALSTVAIHYGWRLVRFDEHPHGIEAELERVDDGATHRIRADYMVGADGPRSTVRQRLGFGYAGEEGAVRDFFDGRMFAVYLRAPEFYQAVQHPPAWMNVTFNPERRAFMAAVDGKGEFAFHTQLRAHEIDSEITPDRALALFQAAVGARVGGEILSLGTWLAGYALVAEQFQRGRVFIAGDAAHLFFTPAGGLGYNTAIEDAVNLGWKLAAVVRGQGGQNLLSSYQGERQPVAKRNTGYARQFAESLGLFVPAPEIEDDSLEGAEARRKAGDYLGAHGKAEFNIPGITFGARYSSAIIMNDGKEPPPDSANKYVPSACPGGRAPHLWLSREQSLYDLFGFEWTLLRLSRNAGGQRIVRAGTDAGLSLKVVDLFRDDARDLYEADLALIRPDQIVAWRGNSEEPAVEIVARVLGLQGSDALNEQ